MRVHHADDLRNDVASLLHEDDVAVANVLAHDLVGIVKSCH
jgi:hypothetical protein